MSLAQPPGLYRQREQTATKRLDSLGDRAGDTPGSQQSLVFSAQPWAFPLHICMGLFCREKGERFASAQGCYPRNIWEFSISALLSLPCSCIVTGDVKGQVKFYDGQLQLLACYSHSKVGPIQSISFSKTPLDPPGVSPACPTSCTGSSQPFVAR